MLEMIIAFTLAGIILLVTTELGRLILIFVGTVAIVRILFPVIPNNATIAAWIRSLPKRVTMKWLWWCVRRYLFLVWGVIRLSSLVTTGNPNLLDAILYPMLLAISLHSLYSRVNKPTAALSRASD